MTLSAIQYPMIVIRNWSMNTEFLWLKCLQINLPTRATRLMPLVERNCLSIWSFLFNVLLIIVYLLPFRSLHCWCLFDLRPVISSNVFLQSSWHYFK